MPSLAGIHVVFQHIPAGGISLATAHLLDIVNGIVVIAPLDRLVKQVLERLHAVVRVVSAGVELVGIGLILHAGALGQELLVERLQLGRTVLGQLAAHQGQGAHVAAGFHQDVRGFFDQGHIPGIGADGRREVVQGVVQFASANQDIGIGQLIVGIGRSDAHNLLQRIFGRLGVPALPGLLVGGFQHVKIVAVDGGVVGVDLGQAPQEDIGLLEVAHLLVQVHLPEPQTLPVRVHLQQLVHITDGAGIVARDFLHIHQEGLGVYVVIIDLAGLHQMVTGLVVVLSVPPEAAGQIMQARFFRIILKALVQQFLTLGPTVLGEEIGHLLRIFSRGIPAGKDAALFILCRQSGRHQEQGQYDKLQPTHRDSGV